MANGETTRFAVGRTKGYLTTVRQTGGGLDEVVVRVAKQGSTMAGMMDALGTAVSAGLRRGAPLEEYVTAFSGCRFPPAGATDDPEIPEATSLIDYVGRRLAMDERS